MRRKLAALALAALLAIQTAPALAVFEDGSARINFCPLLGGCSGLLHLYGNPATYNAGVALGNCGYEWRGNVGFFCLEPGEE